MTVQTDFLKRCKALNLHDGKLSDWLDEIESLRQQLASASDEIERLKGDKYVQLGTNSNPAKPEQQRELAGTLEMGQLLGGGSHETAGNSKAERKVTLIDDFRGDLNRLVASATALVELDIEGALVPHGIGGHARGLLSALCIRVQELRQQLAAEIMRLEIALRIKTEEHKCCSEDLMKLRESQAAQIEVMRDALEFMWRDVPMNDYAFEKCEKALAIQSDDSALKAWLGEPIGEVKKHTGSLKDMAIIVWSGEQPAEGTKLYSPKGLK